MAAPVFRPRHSLLFVLPFVAVACTSGGASPPAATSAAVAGSAQPSMSEMPMASELANLHWKLAVSGLNSGSTVTDNAVTVNIAPTGYTFSCAEAGKPNNPAVGHYHVELDHALVNSSHSRATPTATT